MSLIVKERGFGEKTSWYASQFNPAAVDTVACSKGAFLGASRAIKSSERHLKFKLARGLGGAKRAPPPGVYRLSPDYLIAKFQPNT